MVTPDKCEVQHGKLEDFVERRINTCKGDIVTELRRMNDTLDEFSRAFPMNKDGEPDYNGHRAYHDELVEAARAEKEFWTGLRRDVIKKGIFYGLAIVIGLAVIGIQVKLLGMFGK